MRAGSVYQFHEQTTEHVIWSVGRIAALACSVEDFLGWAEASLAGPATDEGLLALWHHLDLTPPLVSTPVDFARALRTPLTVAERFTDAEGDFQ